MVAFVFVAIDDWMPLVMILTVFWSSSIILQSVNFNTGITGKTPMDLGSVDQTMQIGVMIITARKRAPHRI